MLWDAICAFSCICLISWSCISRSQDTPGGRNRSEKLNRRRKNGDAPFLYVLFVTPAPLSLWVFFSALNLALLVPALISEKLDRRRKSGGAPFLWVRFVAAAPIGLGLFFSTLSLALFVAALMSGQLADLGGSQTMTPIPATPWTHDRYLPFRQSPSFLAFLRSVLHLSQPTSAAKDGNRGSRPRVQQQMPLQQPQSPQAPQALQATPFCGGLRQQHIN